MSINVEEIPADLFSHPEVIEVFPIETKDQELPIEKLTWKNFEILCLKLARKESDPKSCRLYGTRGQEQGGIDIYGKIPQKDKYNVYQCKHEKSFGPQKIADAVVKFLEGDWVEKSEKFVLCCKEKFDSTQRQTAIEAQRAILKEKNIEFETWDYDELNILLKKHHDIVFDLFGLNWVRAFCGDEIAKIYENRINPIEITSYIKSCHNFYELLFQKADPGLPFSSDVNLNDVSIIDRFVMPDISKEENLTIYYERKKEEDVNRNQNKEFYDHQDHYNHPAKSFTTIHNTNRIAAIDWFQSRQRYIVSGEAGSGKSTLLRYIMLNLLNVESEDNRTAKIWGDSLPIWLPFAFWTKILSEAQGEQTSLEEVVRSWLKSWSEEKLWPLFEKALADEKVLIIIDGIDEGFSIETSKIALAKLDIFLQRREKASCIISLRPHAHSLLRGSFDQKKWNIGNVLGFSSKQKQLYSHKWYSIYLSKLEEKRKIEKEAIVIERERRVKDFNEELAKSNDLSILSSNPLMLSVLFFHHVSNITLPTDKLKIYDSLVTQFVKQHPSNRRVSTNVAEDTRGFDDSELIRAVAYISHKMLSDSEISFSEDKIINIFYEFLTEDEFGFSYDKGNARKLSKELFKLCTEEVSILIEKYPGNFGFIHKSFLEYFAACHIFRLSFDEQKNALEEKLSNGYWHQTLVFLLLSYERVDEIKTVIKHLMLIKDKDKLRRKMVALVLKDFLPSTRKVPSTESLLIVNMLIDEMELSENSEYREVILGGFLKLVFNPRLTNIILSKVEEWGISYSRWRGREILLMKDWKYDEKFKRFILRGLYDEENQVKRSTAQLLVQLFDKDSDLSKFLKNEMYYSESDEIRATCFEAMIERDLSDDEINKFLEICNYTDNTTLKLMAVCGRVKQNKILDADLETLMQLSDYPGGVDYYWKDLLEKALIRGWSSSSRLRDACLVTASGGGPREINIETATKILITAFANDPLAQDWIREELKKKTPFLMLHQGAWKILQSTLIADNDMKEDIDKWMDAQEFREPEASFAALITKSDHAKNVLIKNLNGSLPFWSSRALLAGWGQYEGKKILLEYFEKSNSLASNIAGEYILIEKDKQVAKTRLLKILDGDLKSCRIDIVSNALLEVCNGKYDEEVISKLLNIVETTDSFFQDTVFQNLILGGYWDERVQKEAHKQLYKRYASVGTVVKVCEADKLMKDKIMSSMFPLDSNSRSIIVSFLRENVSLFNSEQIDRLYLKFKAEDDANVLTALYIGRYEHLYRSSSITPEMVAELQEELFAVGFSYEGVRASAFCGLIAIKQAELALTAQSPQGHEQLFILDKYGFYKNTVLINYIIQNWTYLKTSFNERFSDFFIRENESGISFENYLPFISSENEDAYSDLSKLVLERLIDDNIKKYIEEIEFACRFNLRNNKIEELLKALIINPPQNENFFNESSRMARSFSLYFKDDDNIESFLEKNMYKDEVFLNEAVAIAACEMFPESQLVDNLLAHCKAKKLRITFELSFRLNCIKGSCEKIFEIFCDLVIGEYVGDERLTSMFLRPLLLALTKREDCKNYFEEKLQNGKLHLAVEFNLRCLMAQVNPAEQDALVTWLNTHFALLEERKIVNLSIWNLHSVKWETLQEAIIGYILPITP